MDKFNELSEKIKLQLLRDGRNVEDINKIFTQAKNNELEYITELYKTYSYWSSVYSNEDLTSLKSYNVPEEVVKFYKDYEPKGSPMVYGGVSLFDLDAIKEYNSSGFPGAYLIKFGVITIANTIGGNSICIDINNIVNSEPRVIGVDHSIIYCSDEHNRPEIVAREVTEEEISAIDKGELSAEDLIEWLSYENLIKYVPEISPTFSEFLQGLADEIVDYEDIDNTFF